MRSQVLTITKREKVEEKNLECVLKKSEMLPPGGNFLLQQTFIVQTAFRGGAKFIIFKSYFNSKAGSSPHDALPSVRHSSDCIPV